MPQIIYFPSILSLLFVLSHAKLKEANEKNWFYNTSVNEQFERKGLFHTIFLTSFNSLIPTSFKCVYPLFNRL